MHCIFLRFRDMQVSISKHLVQSPVVVLSADYGWTAQMEKVMKSQAFADQSKFEFMKSKRTRATAATPHPIPPTPQPHPTPPHPTPPTPHPSTTTYPRRIPNPTGELARAGMFEINPRHPMIVELNSRLVADPEGDDLVKDMVMSLYLSAVVSAGYQLMPEDAQASMHAAPAHAKPYSAQRHRNGNRISPPPYRPDALAGFWRAGQPDGAKWTGRRTWGRTRSGTGGGRRTRGGRG